MRTKESEVEDKKESQRYMRSFRAIGSWWLDVKLGIRMLAKYPALALIGGFGIAVAVAIAAGGYSIIYGNFLATLPLEEGDRIVSIEIWDAAASNPERRILHDYHLWRDALTSIQEVGAFRTLTPNLIAPGAQLASVRVASISASGFKVPRVRPLMGRYLVEDDERQGAPAVAVIGESVWRNRFGADPAILGRIIQLDTASYSIVGVMPASFAFPVNHRLWVPLRVGSTTPEPLTGAAIMVFGRLAPGATLETARAELTTLVRRTALAFPKLYAQLRPLVMPYANPFMGLHENKDGGGLHIMQGIVSLLLVLVCMNIAILVYSRTAMRQAEIAIRTALGAGRARIVGQLFIEALVLSALAAAAGVGIAALALRQVGAATQQIASDLPFWLSFQVSPQSVLYAAVLSVLAAAIVGIVPALKATRGQVQTGLRVIGAGGSGMRLGRTWTMLIVAQVACAVAILPTALSQTWAETRYGIAGPEFAADEFLHWQLGMDGVPDTDAPGAREVNRRYATRHAELMRRLQADRRVSGVTFSMVIPGDERDARIEIDGSGTSSHEVRFNRVDINFFRTFDVPVLAGRVFESPDVAPAGANPGTESSAVVVNQSFAQQIFGGDALGRRIRYASVYTGAARQNVELGRWYQIVGIVRDFPPGVSPGMDGTQLTMYHAIAPGQVQPAIMAAHVRGGAALTFAGPLREIAAAVDPDLHLSRILSLAEALRRDQWINRAQAAVLVAVTLSVLLLSAAGIYALMSITVSQRRKEIGIRTALGADPKRIVAGIFSRAFRQLAIGAAVGMAAAAALERALGFMRGNAAVVLPLVALLMMAVGFLAALGPARRSLRIEPTEALRQQ